MISSFFSVLYACAVKREVESSVTVTKVQNSILTGDDIRTLTYSVVRKNEGRDERGDRHKLSLVPSLSFRERRHSGTSRPMGKLENYRLLDVIKRPFARKGNCDSLSEADLLL